MVSSLQNLKKIKKENNKSKNINIGRSICSDMGSMYFETPCILQLKSPSFSTVFVCFHLRLVPPKFCIRDTQMRELLPEPRPWCHPHPVHRESKPLCHTPIFIQMSHVHDQVPRQWNQSSFLFYFSNCTSLMSHNNTLYKTTAQHVSVFVSLSFSHLPPIIYTHIHKVVPIWSKSEEN